MQSGGFAVSRVPKSSFIAKFRIWYQNGTHGARSSVSRELIDRIIYRNYWRVPKDSNLGPAD